MKNSIVVKGVTISREKSGNYVLAIPSNFTGAKLMKWKDDNRAEIDKFKAEQEKDQEDKEGDINERERPA
jgi:hypothetical protein